MSLTFQNIVSRFLVYRVVSRFSFYVPIFVVAVLASGFSFQAVGGILLVYGVATMTFGGVAQRLLEWQSPVAAITWGETFKMVSNVLIGLVLFDPGATGTPVALAVLLAAQVVGGAGYAFAAVGDGSYLAKAMLGVPAESQARAQARSSSYMFISFLAAGCVGAVVFQVMPAMPFFMTALANIAAGVIARVGLRLPTSAATAVQAAGTAEAADRSHQLQFHARGCPYTATFGPAGVVFLRLQDRGGVLRRPVRDVYLRGFPRRAILSIFGPAHVAAAGRHGGSCILPWKKNGEQHIPEDGSRELMMNSRNTSCFVIKFGTPSENIVRTLWAEQGKLVFASSANPSGKGNRGLVEGIGERIESEADLIVEANDYVASIQPGKDVATRYEQGVMVSMVDAEGRLVPLQTQQPGVSPVPTLIRKGLSVDYIVARLSDAFTNWDFRHGQYY